ncbi:MAG: transporter [Verrucomicrobiota bacterium]
MKAPWTCLLLGACWCALTSNQTQAATFSGHYPSGAEGIKGASLPPPGLYLRDYNLFYDADYFPGGPKEFEAVAYINAPRLIYITDYQIFGANYGLDLLVPFYYGQVQFDAGGSRFKDSTFAMGDLQFEPLLLAWHFKQFDFGAGYAFWAPTGDYNRDGQRPSRLLGKGFWSHMITAGVTYYPDAEKAWALSALNRYEIHHEHQDFDFTAGDTDTLEFGISKSVTKSIEIGAVGYYQKQTTSYTPAASGPMDHVVALGPEVSAFWSKLGLFTSLRYVREFDAKQRPEGNTVTLTLTKRW